jgi:hypothetical protein
MTWNHTRSGYRVLSKIVPDVIDVRLRHALQRNVPPVIRHGSSITPQNGQANPFGHRMRST